MLYALLALVFTAGLSIGFVAGCLACVRAVADQDERIRIESEDWFARQKQNGGDRP